MPLSSRLEKLERSQRPQTRGIGIAFLYPGETESVALKRYEEAADYDPDRQMLIVSFVEP